MFLCRPSPFRLARSGCSSILVRASCSRMLELEPGVWGCIGQFELAWYGIGCKKRINIHD